MCTESRAVRHVNKYNDLGCRSDYSPKGGKSIYLSVRTTVHSCFFDQLLIELVVQTIYSLYTEVLFQFLWKASWQLGSWWLRAKKHHI